MDIGNPTNMYSGQSFSTSATSLAGRLDMEIPYVNYKFAWLGIGFLAGGFISSETLPEAANPYWGTDLFSFLVGAIPGTIIGVVFGFIFKAFEVAQFQETKKKYWKAKEIYRSAFYCFRDDIVFDHKQHGNPEKFQELLLKRLKVIE
jgi:hypothetical protein